MKILVVSQYYYPEQFRITEICEELVRRGHRVTVLTGRPNYPEGEIYPGYAHIRRETHNGVEIVRCQIRPRKRGAAALAVNYMSFLLRGWLRAGLLPKDFDVVFVYQLSPVTMAAPALRYKRRCGVPMYLYCLDLWPESIRDSIPNTASLPYRLVHRWSRKLYNGADAVGITSKPFRDYLSSVCAVPTEKVTYLPQHGEDMQRYGDLSAAENGVTDFVFLGNVGVAQDLENLVRAVQLMNTAKPFTVHIVGTGPMLEPLKELAQTLGVESHFQFHGRHPLEEMPRFYRLADVCLLTLYADNAAGQTIPGKLQGYMSAGKPVVAAVNGAAADLIREAQCGICAPAGDPAALAKAMTDFMEHPEQAARMGQNGRAYFERHFSLDIFTASLEQQLAGLCRKK